MVKTKERTVDLAFSSEEPVIRGWGIEILDHSNGCMRGTRTKDGLPLLWNHDTGTLLGRLMDVTCDKDKKGRGTARFSRNPNAMEKWADVEDGILTDVSVGYRVHFLKEIPAKELSPDLMELAAREKLPVYRITDWEPYECSLVTAPADPTVGVGRSAVSEKGQEDAVREVPQAIIEIIKPKEEERKMSEDKKTLDQIEADVTERVKVASKNAEEAATARVKGINELHERFASFVPKFVRDKAISDGMPLTEFQKLVLGRVESGKPIDLPAAELGLSRNDVKRYSVTRAILSQWGEAKIDAGFEMACHQELVKRGIESQKGGILVPCDVMRQNATPGGTSGRRDLDTSSSSGALGGYTVGTDNLGSEFIDLLRNTTLIRRLGARVLSGLRGNVTIPKRTVGVVSYWVGEGVAPTEGANTFAQITLSPKNVGANLDYTRNLLLQSNPSIDGLVNGDLAASLATAIDKAAFHGSGNSGQPQGIVGSGTGSVTATSVSLTKMLEFQTDVAAANALAANCAYVTTPAVAGILASQPRFTYGTRPLWEGNLLESPDCCGLRGYATNQLTAGYCIFGDFSQVLIGEWGSGLELVVDPYTQSKTGIIQVTAFQTIDIGVRHPLAFSVSTSVTAP